jgi:hypothetical protein
MAGRRTYSCSSTSRPCASRLSRRSSGRRRRPFRVPRVDRALRSRCSSRARDRCLRLVARAASTRFIAELAAMLPRIATISIPPVTERHGDVRSLAPLQLVVEQGVSSTVIQSSALAQLPARARADPKQRGDARCRPLLRPAAEAGIVFIPPDRSRRDVRYHLHGVLPRADRGRSPAEPPQVWRVMPGCRAPRRATWRRWPS